MGIKLIDICTQCTFPDGRKLIKIWHDWFSPNECIETKRELEKSFIFAEESDDVDGHHWAIVIPREVNA